MSEKIIDLKEEDGVYVFDKEVKLEDVEEENAKAEADFHDKRRPADPHVGRKLYDLNLGGQHLHVEAVDSRIVNLLDGFSHGMDTFNSLLDIMTGRRYND